MHAILEAGGKQHRVEPDTVFIVEKLTAEPGEVVEFDRVALVERNGRVRIGNPWVKGARVACRVLGQLRGRKLNVSTYSAKTNTKRKVGHRQPYTRLRVEKITVGRSRTKKES
ncbi:MAG: 50S ribosomal protein L21 [Armatimonadota bacterium]|nr:MAG: 50S ribosomal protein L21 [Armatimonadota bacterium]